MMREVFPLLFFVLPVALLAHEGHGMFHDSWLHYFTDALHLFPSLLVVLLIGWLTFHRFQKSKNRL